MAKSYLLVIVMAIYLVGDVRAVGHGGICRLNESEYYPCDSGLECIYGKCSCRTAEGYVYDADTKSCRGLAKSPCEADSNCGSNMVCSDLFCECDEGYSLTKGFTCAKSFGSNCTTTSDECNVDINLKCSSASLCRCSDETKLLYDEGLQSCVAKVSQPCDVYTDFHGFPNGDTGFRCGPNAACMGQGNATRTCMCADGYEVNGEGSCQPKTEGNSASRLVLSAPWLLVLMIQALG